MNRLIFVRVATKALRESAGQPPEVQAEAIAREMDYIADLLGEAPPAPAAAAPPPPVARTPFPAPNPEAIVPVAAPEPSPSRIVTDTRMPPPEERAKPAPAAEPLRSLRPKAQDRMKVEDLNLLIQQRTPPFLELDVPMEDGTTYPAVFERDVISRHGYDAVQLVYFPKGARGSMRDLTEAIASISIDDLPLDLGPVLSKLAVDAVEAVRPKGQPRELPVRPSGGPVMHSGDEGRGNDGIAKLSAQTQAVFNTIG